MKTLECFNVYVSSPTVARVYKEDKISKPSGVWLIAVVYARMQVWAN